MPSFSAKSPLPDWFNPSAIETALSRESAPEASVIQSIIDKSLALKALSQDEIVALLRLQNKEDRKNILEAANKVKQKVYGDRIIPTAPLHVDNHCACDCRYCAYKSSNLEIARKKLSMNG